MQSFIGFDENAILYNRDYTVSDARPGITIHETSFVSPIWSTIEGNLLEEVGGGAFDPHGNFIETIAQPRSDGRNAIRIGQIVKLPFSVPGKIPKAVFGGVAFDHFGHFLLEASARLWCLPEYAGLPWLFLTEGRAALKSYQRDFLVVLGLSPDQIIPVSDWIEIGELIVPEPAFVYHHHATHAYRDIFRNAPLAARPGPGRKIFLSRTNTTIATTIGERELEDILRHNGWDIVYPEMLPADEQASLFRDENIILGLQGSALHLGLFAPKGRRVVHLCRGLGYRGYYILDDLMEADATYFNAMRNHELPSKPISGPFLLDLDMTLAFLREQALIAPQAAGVAAVPEKSRAVLENNYAAWWHYTESQIRFHHQISHDEKPVPQITALDSALQAAALDPQNPVILCHALALLLKFEGVESAGTLLDKYAGADFLEFANDNPLLLYYISLIRDAEQNFEDAIAAAQRAHTQEPGNPTYAHQLAALHYRLGQYYDAEIISEKVVERGTAIASNYFLLSLLSQTKQDEEAAVAWAKQAFKADRHDETIFNHLVRLLKSAGQFEDMLDAYRKYTERRTMQPKILLEVAALEQRLGEPEAAAKHFLQAYGATPDDLEISAQCRKSLIEIGQLPDLSNLGILPSPAMQDQGVMVYRRSVALAAEGAGEQALQVAIMAVEFFPDNETIMGHLLSMMLQTSRSLQAHLLIDYLISQGQVSAMLFYVLSLVESDLGQTEKARLAAQRAAHLAPDNTEIVQHYVRFTSSEINKEMT